MKFNFNRLSGRIVERFGTRTAFAKALGLSKSSLSNRLSGLTPFTMEDIFNGALLLEIPDGEIGTYFFNCEVR